MPPTSTSSRLDRARDAVGDLAGHAERPRRDAAGDRLAEGEHVGLEAVRGRPAARPGRERVRLVDDQHGAVPAGQLAQRVVVAGVREHDADVGQRGLAQDGRDLTGRERLLQPVDVVELHGDRGLGRVDRRADVAAPGDRTPRVVQRRERLVDAAVVAEVVHDDLAPAGEVPGVAHGVPVGVGRGQGELPQRQPEPPPQLGRDHHGVLGGQHRGDALGRPGGVPPRRSAAASARSWRRCRRGRGRRSRGRRRHGSARRTPRRRRRGTVPATWPSSSSGRRRA